MLEDPRPAFFLSCLGDFKRPSRDNAGHEFPQQVSTNPKPLMHVLTKGQVPGQNTSPDPSAPLSSRHGKDPGQVTHIVTGWHQGREKILRN